MRTLTLGIVKFSGIYAAIRRDLDENLVKRHVQGNLERTAGARYRVSDDKIFLVDKKTYNRILKKAKQKYNSWLENQQPRS